MEVGKTGYVILGMLRMGRRTGYEIKSLVDCSTRFFWAASYGQIYPELRRLEERGLIEEEPGANGTGRQKRPYRLTAAGEEALDAWLGSDEPLVHEMRDEGLLKLFFSDGLPLDERLAIVAALRARHEEKAAKLRSIEPFASRRGGGPYATLRYGLASAEFSARWLADLERELQETESLARR